MIETMYDAPGVGLAAPQVGVAEAALRLRPPRRHRAPGPHQPRDHRVPRRVDLRGGLPVGARPVVGDRAARTRSTSPASTSTATRSRSRPTSTPAGSSSTSSTTSTACCCVERLDDDQRKQAKRAVREMLIGPLGRAAPQREPLAATSRRGTGAAAAPRRTSARRRWPSRRCGPWSTPGSTSPWSCRRPTSAAGRGGALTPEPGQGGRARARPAGHRRGRRRARRSAPTSAWWWPSAGIIKPHVLGRAADGQPALLAAAPLAGRGAGRAGDPGRRRAHRRVRDGRRGGPRHRRRLRLRARCRSARTTTADELRAELVEVGHAGCWSTRCVAGLGDARAAGGRADLRREDRPGRARDRLDAGRRRRSTASCGSAARGRRSAGRRLKVWRRRGPTGRRSRPSPHRATARSSCVEVQPEGKAPHAGRRLGHGAPALGDGAAVSAS